MKMRSGRPVLPHNTMGTISELIVASDLMLRGYEVFRALSPASSCDLLAMGSDGILRIEVRTGCFNPATGRVSWSRNTTMSHGKRSDADLDHYAVVTYQDGVPVITYEPAISAAL